MTALFLLLACQDKVIVPFGHAHRSEIHLAAQRCTDAEKLIERDPQKAVALLDEVLKLEQELRPEYRPAPFERRVTIEQKANDYTSPFDFFPFQFRGRARMALAREAVAKKARELLVGAVEDLEESVRRKAAASEGPLKSAKEALRSRLREDLGYERRAEADASLTAPARKALAGVEGVAGWLLGELEKAKADVAKLKAEREQPATKGRAERTAAWCAIVAEASKDIDSLKDACGEAGRLRAEAEGVAAYKGSFRLKIGVHPHARLVRLSREGRAIPLQDVHTPLVVPMELEIGRYEVVLEHPEWGERKVAIAPEELEKGRTHVLSGDMKTGTFKLTRAP